MQLTHKISVVLLAMKFTFVRVFVLIFSIIVVGVSCGARKNGTAKKGSSTAANVEVVKSIDSLNAPNIVIPVAKPVEVDVVEEIVKVQLPAVSREFRAAWIATVANINWPSKNNLSTEQQKLEAIRLLDFLKENNFNAVIFQVRPSADALYNSPHEPWSYFLTGGIGRQPNPYYDPLEFWVSESHKRGLELHVWLNPYRAHHSNGGVVSDESMVRKASDYVVRLKNGMYWFDPSDKRTQDHASRVVNDIVRRYDIDGVHFDDYFYPYATYNGGMIFRIVKHGIFIGSKVERSLVQIGVEIT